MNQITSVLAAAVLAIGACQIALAAPDLQRGVRNYQEVIAGRKKLDSLSRDEQQEVFAVMRRVRSQSYQKKSSECRDAVDEARSAADELASAAKRLQSCAEDEDFDDDCSSEASSAASAASDYEDATSKVQSECR